MSCLFSFGCYNFTMQTFLPYDDFIESAKVLDWRRLGKQRVEVKQLLNALEGKSKGWVNHPATKMWRGYETALKAYGDIIIVEWVSRGYKNNMQYFLDPNETQMWEYPPWFGNEEFHRSHRSNLTRKDPTWYSQFWTEPDDLPYIWPTNEETK